MRPSAAVPALAILLSLVAGVRAASGPSLSCCLSVSNTVLRRNRVADYRIQSAPLCPVDAVVFLTNAGKSVCSDPEKKWVRKAIRWVDNKKKMTANVQTTEQPKSSLGKPRKQGRKRTKQEDKQKKN